MKPTQHSTAQPLLAAEIFQPAFRRSTLASAVISSALAAGAVGVAQAQSVNQSGVAQPGTGQAQSTQQSAAQENVTTLAPVEVTGQAPYQATEASSPRITAPLRDTPRTILVVPERLMQDRGVSTLAEVLRTTPGITMGAGEGGTPVGDRPFLRGYDAGSDLTIDGVRDFARGYRETFNLEAVEIVKGPSSAYGGRGGTGGTINMQTKAPRNYNFASGTVGGGNASQWSGTADVNHVVSDHVAVRLNAMRKGGYTPGRDFVKVNRFGVAPSLALGLGLPTRMTVSYSETHNKDTPDFGMPFNSPAHPEIIRPVGNIDRHNFYGRRYVDFRDSWARQGTLLLEHDLTDALSLRNITRYSKTQNAYLSGRPSFPGLPNPPTNPPNAGQCAPNSADPTCDPRHPDAEYINGSRARWRGSQTLINQTDLTGSFKTGAFEHSFATGIEVSRDRLFNRGMTVTGIGNNARESLHDPQNSLRYPNASITYGAKTAANDIKTRSIYVFDTMKISDQFQVNGGVRYEDFEVTNYTITRRDQFANWQLGTVYKPAANGSVYLTYSTSSNPAGEDAGQGGGAFGSASNATVRDLAPEKTRNIELGTKWDVFGERLSVMGSIFEIRKTDARSTDPDGTVRLNGNNRSRGVELGVSGAITSKWDMWAGYTYIDAKNIKYVSGSNDFSGNRLKFTPKHAASLWTTYKVLPALTVGGGVTHMGWRYADDNNRLELPGYTTYDMMVRYDVTSSLSLQLNGNNLSDTEQYDASHIGTFYSVGPGRSLMLTASYRYE